MSHDRGEEEGEGARWPDILTGPVSAVYTGRSLRIPVVTELHLFSEARGCLARRRNNLLQLSSLADGQYGTPESLRAAS